MPGYTMEHSFMHYEGMAQGVTEHVMRYQADKKDSKRQAASTGLAAGNQLLQKSVPHRSYGLEQICSYLKENPNAPILNLGNKNTHSSDFFQSFSTQIYAEDIIPSLIPTDDDDSEVALRQHALCYDDGLTFDVILAWDLFNFCSRTQLKAICQKLRPHMHSRTQIFSFFYTGSETPERPQKCYVVDEQNLALLPSPKQQRVATEITAGAVLKTLGDFHLAQTYILRPGMHRGIYEYIFQAGMSNAARTSATKALIL
jgi:hypothetical protein